MLRAVCFAPCLFVLALACSSAPLPEGVGRGVIAFDPSPPADAELYQRPQPVAGTRYALLRGGRQRQDYSIAAIDDQGLVVVDPAGHQLRRDLDLGYVGEWNDKGEALQLFAPKDVRYHWPLWVGKRWRCEYVVRKRGLPPLTLEVAYRVEDLDRVEVGAGNFEALRILRRATLKVEGEDFLEQTSVCWYAPAIGFEVRQILDGTTIELLEWTVPTS